ncbi:MAG: hypothetical protein ACREDS_03380 [Limisphaerales bacterium]
MKLGKLLAAGKSVKGGRGTISYRENKRIYLPKFGSPKNPPVTSKKMKSAEPQKNEAESVIAPVPKMIAAKTQKMLTVSAGPSRATTWTERFNPLTIWRESAAEAKDSPHATQAELSLEKVKVVHNDLSDVDVEIVPIKSRSVREIPEPAFRPAVSEDADKNFWSRLDKKFFGADAA